MVVFDEAHRHTNKSKIMECLCGDKGSSLLLHTRILALTASPGRDIPTIQKVVDNLKIACIEFRTENDTDLLPFVFDKEKRELLVDLPSEFKAIVQHMD